MRAPEFWRDHDHMARLVMTLLSPVSWAYATSVAWKAAHAKPYRSSVKVICVGNLTAGGSGKTPVAIAIANLLRERGMTPFVLTRGYGGRERGPLLVDAEQQGAAAVGDEALMMARVNPVIVSRDRAAGARLAEQHGADVIVMDDGHQNFSLAKVLSLVVVDAATGVGNGRVLPAGPLREPVAPGLARADALMLVGDGPFEAANFTGPILHARLVPEDTMGLPGQPVVAFAGIGRPEKFFATLRGLGANLVEARGFPDHHAYTASEIARLKACARANNARLVTTEKDFARLNPAERDGMSCLPVRAVFDDLAALSTLLDTVVPRR
jgi:tetraacyldisaccharide 4'-kinase